MKSAKDFLKREFRILVASVGASYLWFEFVSSFIGASDAMYLLVGKILVFVLPVSCLLESVVLAPFKKVNAMRVLDSFILIGFITIAPISLFYLWFVGEDLQSRESVSTVMFLILVFGLPWALFQSLARRLVACVNLT